MQEIIREHFNYNPETGVIIRKTRRNSNGSLDKDGYLIIKFKGRQYKAHRLAWFLYYGFEPKKTIDHINRDRLDNRIKNLRDVAIEENIANTVKKANKTTGVVGIYYDNKTKGLKAKYTFRHNKKTYRFRSLEMAILKKKELQGERVNTNTI